MMNISSSLASIIVEENKNMEYTVYKNQNDFERWEYFQNGRKFEDNKTIVDLFKINSTDNKKFKNDWLQITWNPIGPFSPDSFGLKEYDGNGRVNIIKTSPVDSRKIYLGTATGGLWISTNIGKDWKRVESTQVLSMGISDIYISNNASNTIYVATGDIASSIWGTYSVGIIKSNDDGKTWEIISDSLSLSQKVKYSKLWIDPIDDNIIVATATNGIHKSIDGGKKWSINLDGMFIRDLEQKPFDPEVLYASSYDLKGNAKIFYSLDGGDNWILMKQFNNTLRIELAISKAKPERLYFICVDSEKFNCSGLFYTDDFGKNIVALNYIDNQGFDLVRRQGFYNLVLSVNPEDENDIFVGGVYLYRTIDLGSSWELQKDIHVDQHDIHFNQSGRIFSGNDGGIYTYKDKWENISNGLNISQIYRVAQSPRNENIVYLGAQDIGNRFQFYSPTWNSISNADGMETIIDIKNNQIVFFSVQRGQLYRSENFGLYPYNLISNFSDTLSKPWLVPIKQSRFNSFLYYCLEDLFVSDNLGNSWKKMINLPDNKNYIRAIDFFDSLSFVFSNDSALYYYDNHSFKAIKNTHEIITDLFIVDDDTYISYSGYTSSRVEKFSKGIFFDFTYNLPNVPINKVCYLKDEKILLCGTDIGLFAFDEELKEWNRFGIGLPDNIVTDIDYNILYKKIIVSFYGSGVYEAFLQADTLDIPTLTQSGELYLCDNDSAFVEVFNAKSDIEYIWQDGFTGTSRFISQSGLYYVTAKKTLFKSKSSNYLKVFQNVSPKLDLIEHTNTNLCEGSIVKLEVSAKNYDLSKCQIYWSNGQTNIKGNYFKSGDAWVKVITPEGCVAVSDTIKINFFSLPEKPLISKKGNFLYSTPAEKYQWYYLGKKLEEEIGKSIYVTQNGSYYIEITNINGCKNTSDVFSIESDSNKVLLYPNPTNGNVMFDIFLNTKDNIHLIVYNILGEKVYEIKYFGIENYFSRELFLQDLPKGIYYFRFLIGSNNLDEILIKQ